MREPLLAQETVDSRAVPAGMLAAKLLRERGNPTRIIEVPKLELRIEPAKKWLGFLTVRQERRHWVQVSEVVPVWSIYPQCVLDTDYLYNRFLAADGRVFENDIDFGISEAYPPDFGTYED